MKITTLFLMALLLSAESKLTTEEKLNVLRMEAAAAKANAELTGFANYANSEIRKREEAARQKSDALAAIVAELKRKYGINPSCVLDDNQEAKMPVVEKQPDGSSKTTLVECPAEGEKK